VALHAVIGYFPHLFPAGRSLAGGEPDRGMAADAEIVGQAIGRLAGSQHKSAVDRVVPGVGMHGSLPLRVDLGMAPLAELRRIEGIYAEEAPLRAGTD